MDVRICHFSYAKVLYAKIPTLNDLLFLFFLSDDERHGGYVEKERWTT